VGDDPVNDIIAAQNFGMMTILLRVDDSYREKWRKYDYGKCLPDAEVRNLLEVLSIIE